MKGFQDITKLINKVNPDELIYRYKGYKVDAEFNEFHNAFRLLNKIRDGKISLADCKM